MATVLAPSPVLSPLRMEGGSWSHRTLMNEDLGSVSTGLM